MFSSASAPADVEDAPPAGGSRWVRHAAFFGTAALIVFLDQLTKAAVRATLMIGESWPDDWIVRLTHVNNTGAAFGMLQGQTAFLAVTSVLGVGAILLYYRAPPVDHGLIGPVLGLVLGGAIGNFIDRVRLGYVTDFVDFPHYPKFNVADSAITVGVIALLALILLVPGRQRAESQ